MSKTIKEIYRDYLRWMYRSGRPNWLARVQNRGSAILFAAGVWPGAAALEVVGRRTGRVTFFPVVVAEHAGNRYLVSMLGEKANWVQNVRADGGRAVLRHGIREGVRLEDVPVAERAEIIRSYLKVAPGARPHIPVDPNAPLAEIAALAPKFPVFKVLSAVAAPSV